MKITREGFGFKKIHTFFIYYKGRVLNQIIEDSKRWEVLEYKKIRTFRYYEGRVQDPNGSHHIFDVLNQGHIDKTFILGHVS